jgi:hypothetical protein
MAARCSNSSARPRHDGVSAAAAPQQAVCAGHDVVDLWRSHAELALLARAPRRADPRHCHIQVPSGLRWQDQRMVVGGWDTNILNAVDRIKSTLPTLVLRTAPFLGDVRSRVSESEFSGKNTRFVKISFEALLVSVASHLSFALGTMLPGQQIRAFPEFVSQIRDFNPDLILPDGVIRLVVYNRVSSRRASSGPVFDAALVGATLSVESC